MATRTDVYLSHDLARFDDVAATIERLSAALPQVIAVRDYWHEIDPDSPHEDLEQWEVFEDLGDEVSYDGPGSLRLYVRPAAANLYASVRWRDLLFYDRLREVHVAAFRAIARALGSATIAVCPDYFEEVGEAFSKGASHEQCLTRLRETQGPPQPTIETISPQVLKDAEHCPPSVWYLVTV